MALALRAAGCGLSFGGDCGNSGGALASRCRGSSTTHRVRMGSTRFREVGCAPEWPREPLLVQQAIDNHVGEPRPKSGSADGGPRRTGEVRPQRVGAPGERGRCRAWDRHARYKICASTELYYRLRLSFYWTPYHTELHPRIPSLYFSHVFFAVFPRILCDDPLLC